MVKPDEQHMMEFVGSQEVVRPFPERRGRPGVFPTIEDYAFVEAFLRKQYAEAWDIMPEREKQDEVERNVEAGARHAREVMGGTWESLSDVRRSDMFRTSFLDIPITEAQRRPMSVEPEPESAPEAQPAPLQKFPGFMEWNVQHPEITNWSQKRKAYLEAQTAFRAGTLKK